MVVLPAPFGPSSPKTVPAAMLRSTPSTAVVAPKRLIRPRATMAFAVVVGVVVAVMPATVRPGLTRNPQRADAGARRLTNR